MSGFVVGGLLGAAAAMYFNRGGRTLNMGTLTSAGQALDRIVDSARGRMMSPDPRSGSTYPKAANSTTATGGMSQVESIVHEDPELAAQVNDILSENQDTVTIR